jgi:diacylglycerol kinase family enzyme
VDERHPEGLLVQRDGGVEVGDGDADVVDAREHAGEGTLRRVRVALVANRASGGGLDPEPLVAAMRERGAEVSVFSCEEEELARVPDAAPERIVVAGGDGTVGSVAELAGRIGVPLGAVPAGTANDYVRAVGLPLDPLEAARVAVSGTETRRFELGRLADGRPFVNVASAGLASLAARRAAPLKPKLGPLAYAVGAAHAGATARPLRATVRADGATVFDGEAWQVILAVTGAFGGGSRVGAADPSDGVLDVTILPAGSRAGLVRRAWGLKRHTIAEQRGVEHHRGHVIEVDGAGEFNADGELREGGLERVTVERDAYELVVGG